MADRTNRTFATSKPSGVAITTDAANPSSARCTEVQTMSQISPLTTTFQNSCHTENGEGSLYSDQNAADQRPCQITSAMSNATTGGTVLAAKRLQRERS